jgi:cystathionine beta-lyase/cystathionine gamma-synthase
MIMRFETRAIHAGQEPDEQTGSVTVPIYQTSTYRQYAVGINKGYEYARFSNPTRNALEVALSSLEEGKYGLAFASGVAATTAVFSILQQGDHVITGDDMYGGTYRILDNLFKKWGLKITYADVDDPDSFEKAINKNTKLIWIETPTNPLLKIIDIRKLSKVSRKQNIILAVDNTFSSPFFQRPLTLGADIVVHSTTKYIAGHSDVIGGAIVLDNEAIYRRLKTYQNTAGATPGPWDCWLTLRGLKTLSIRMKVHEENALYIARFLSKHPKIEHVYYPGLKSNDNYSVAARQMDGFGGMLSFRIKGGRAEVDKFFTRLKIFSLAESLGGVESLIAYPAGMSHASVPVEKRFKLGITDNFIRVSLGIENKIDLKNDISNALKAV